MAVAGDSFSSGEGAPNEWYGIYNIYQWSPDRMSYYAHRSRNSHWHRSVKWAHRDWYNSLAYEHKTGMYYVNQSWSGAILYDLDTSDQWRTTPTDWADYYEESTVDRKGATTLARQINAMPYADYDLFCFSHSGNDAGFSDILTQMITWDHAALDFDDIWSSGGDMNTISEFWQYDMVRQGADRLLFAINLRSNEYDEATDQAPPLDEQFELLDSRLLNPDNDFAWDVFHNSTFRNVVLATYPNPVGLPYGDQYYPPFGASDSNWMQFQRCFGWLAESGALGIEPDEAREVINFFMPEVNGRVRAVDNDGAGGRIHIVGHNGRGGIDDIPDFHDKGAMSASPDRLFSGVPGCTSFPPDAEDDPTTMYWFHPNRHGYDRLYVDERSRITSYFDRPYTSSRFSIDDYPFFNPSSTVVDLSIEHSGVTAAAAPNGSWRIDLDLVVKNLGGFRSVPVHLGMEFDFNGEIIRIPVHDLTSNQRVMVPALDGSQSVTLQQTVLVSDTPCVGTKFLVANLAAFIQSAPYILEHLDEFPPEFGSAAWWVMNQGKDADELIRRVCGWVNLWNLHYDQPTSFRFYLPYTPNDEINERVDNNYGDALDTWTIQRKYVSNPKACQQQGMLDCLLSRYDWLSDALSMNDVESWVAGGQEPFASFLKDLNIRQSLLYPILDQVADGAPNPEVPLKTLLDEAVALEDLHGRGLFGGGEMVFFPRGVEPISLRFPQYPNLVLPYAECGRISELFLLDGTSLDAELDYLADGKMQTQLMKLSMPLREYGVMHLGGARATGWMNQTPQVLVPQGFTANALNYVVVDPFSATVLRKSSAALFEGTFRDLFRNLYFTKGLAKICVNRLPVAEEKGYWIEDKQAINSVETLIDSINESTGEASVKATLRGEHDPVLLNGDFTKFECRLSDGFSAHLIPITLIQRTALSQGRCDLLFRIPLGLMRSQFKLIEVADATGRVIVVAPLGDLPLPKQSFASSSPYLHVDSVVRMTVTDFNAKQKPGYLYHDPVDGFVPASLVFDADDAQAAPGSYPVSLHLTNSRNTQISRQFTLQIVANPSPDTDGDGLDDALESSLGTDPQSFDTDGDGLSDRIESINGFIGKNNHPLVGALKMESNGSVMLEAIVGKRYQLETSADLIHWTPYGDGVRAEIKNRLFQIPDEPAPFFLRARQY